VELRKTYITRLFGEDLKAVVVRDGAGKVWVETPTGALITDALVLDGGRTVSIRQNGRMYLVDLTPPGSSWHAALLGGRGGKVEVLDELAAAAAEQVHAGSSRAEVSAEMPGLVVEYKCSVGDEVEAGQALVILEAMKMQNELSSPSSGVVSEILVKAGSTVAAGTALLRLQPKAAEAQ